MLQRKASRKKKRSKNWEKAQLKVAKLHHQISNTRKNFHFQTSHTLCDQADMIFVEDINFKMTAKGFLGNNRWSDSPAEGCRIGVANRSMVDLDNFETCYLGCVGNVESSLLKLTTSLRVKFARSAIPIRAKKNLIKDNTSVPNVITQRHATMRVPK